MQGAQEKQWLTRLELEQDNLRAALAWCEVEDSTTGAEIGLRLVDVLHELWLNRAQLTEGRRWMERVLALPGGAATPVRVRVLNWAAQFASHQNDSRAVEELGSQALKLARELGYAAGEGQALSTLGGLTGSRGEYAPAVAMLEEAVRICRRAGDSDATWRAINNLAETYRHFGDLDRATRLIEEDLALATSRGDGWGIAQGVRQLGLLAEAREDYARSRDLLEESLVLWQAIGAARGRHWSLLELGRAVHALGDRERARALMGESLRLCSAAWDQRGMARCLEGLASVAATIGQPTRAARLFGAAEALRAVIGWPVLPSERVVCERGVAATRELLGPEQFAAAWTHGQAMPLAHASLKQARWRGRSGRTILNGPLHRLKPRRGSPIALAD
jgi:tetratricopeptide (TPR) repeat protein